MDELDIPPHDITAEQSVLGALMLDSACADEIAGMLSSNDFYRRDHAAIYSAVMELIELNEPVDLLTVWQRMQGGAVGVGLDYLNDMVRNTPSAANVRSYAATVRDRARRRDVLRFADDLRAKAMRETQRPFGDLMDEAETKLFEISQGARRRAGGAREIREVMHDVVARMLELSERGAGEVIGVPTGFTDLDRMLAGLQQGDMIVVAGRPSMGKTAFALNIAQHVAMQQRQTALIFSMEMSDTQLGTRLACSMGKIDAGRARIGKLEEEEESRLWEAAGKFYDAPLLIDERAGLTLMEVRAEARKVARRKGGLSLIVLDYIGLMQGRHGAENRQTEVSEISRGLKALAKELNCPVIVLCQLSRKCEERADKRPLLSDLRESGAIEQDADVVLAVYRDEVYRKDSPDEGSAEIICLKQRNGAIGTVRLAYIGEHTRFEDLARPGSY